ncbi:hypothetical protein TNCV_5139511, partial [Trichonephila clavipes]
SAQQVGFRNNAARGIERFVRTDGYGKIEKSVCQKKRLRLKGGQSFYQKIPGS